MKPWKTTKSDYIVRDRWLTLRADTCETAAGVTVEPYYVLEYPDWVHVVALDPANCVLITRQYRHATGTVCVEIPCGEIEDGESAVDAARRELREETGCGGETLELVSSLCPNPARQSNKTHCFLARNVRSIGTPCPDRSEDMQWEFVTIERLLELIDNGQFSQALHVAGIFMALRKEGLLLK